MRLPNRFAYRLWAGLAILFPLVPLNLYFTGNWYSILHSYSIGMVLGIFAYSYFTITLILSSRIKYFDRIAGHDRVLVFHRNLAAAAFGCAVGHLIFKAVYSFHLSAQLILGGSGFLLFLAVLPISSVAMAQGIVHRIGVVRSLKRIILKWWGIDYTHLKFFHNIMVLAAILIAIHVFLASSTQENSARSGLMSAGAGIALALYAWHKALRPMLNLRNAFTLDRVSPLSPNIVELAFKPGPRPLNNHRAGQFGYFRILDKTCGIEEHPFTISSPPGAPLVTITVKNLGNYTARLPGISAGLKGLLDGPYGVFTPRQDGRPKLFIAGGIGITPFISIIADWNRVGFKQKVSLIWSCRIPSDMVRHELFSACAERHREFSFVPVITGADQKTPYAKRIDRALLEPIIMALERNQLEVFVCGPESLRLSLVRDLRLLGILTKNVHYEKFSQ